MRDRTVSESGLETLNTQSVNDKLNKTYNDAEGFDEIEFQINEALVA